MIYGDEWPCPECGGPHTMADVTKINEPGAGHSIACSKRNPPKRKGWTNLDFYEFVLTRLGIPAKVTFQENGLIDCEGPFTKITCERACELISKAKERGKFESLS